MTDVNADFAIPSAQTTPSLYDGLKKTVDNLPQIEAAHAAISKPTAPGYAPSDFNHQYVTIRGFKYHYVEEGNPEGIPLVLIHGFPEIWYGWRYQIRHLAKEGYRVIVPDNLGSGGTDHPFCELDNLQPYAAKNLATNLIGLLDHLKIDKAVFVGHDWGSTTAWKVGLYFPERCLNIIGICFPHKQPVAVYATPDSVVDEFPEVGHFAVFQTHAPEGWFDGDVHKQAVAYMNSIYFRSKGTNVEQKQYLIEQFSQSSFHGGYNFYRADYLNYLDELPYVGKLYKVPSLQILVENDPLVPLKFVATYPTDLFMNLEQAQIAGEDHNILTEGPETVNKILTEYLAKFRGKKQPLEQEKKQTIEE